METLADAGDILGARPAVVAREITKIHEEFLRGNLANLLDAARKRAPRGEITLLIGPGTAGDASDSNQPCRSSRGSSSSKRATGMDRKAALKAGGTGARPWQSARLTSNFCWIGDRRLCRRSERLRSRFRNEHAVKTRAGELDTDNQLAIGISRGQVDDASVRRKFRVGFRR